MIGGDLSAKDLHPFELPSYEEIADTGVWGLYLGDYLFWDDERQTEWIRDVYGWRETELEGAYKDKGAECVMAGMHDFTCYLKEGFWTIYMASFGGCTQWFADQARRILLG